VSDETWRALPRPGEEVTLQRCGERGPLLVRHAEAVVDEHGETFEVTRPVVAVCTCTKSRRFPWCDSTHKSVRP
jgi:hypothetical protein